MKKNMFWSIAALMAAPLLCLGFTACGDDDDDDSGDNATVEGIWESREDDNYVAIVFYPDGTGRYSELDLDDEDIDDDEFTYTKKGETKGTITSDGITTTYSINGKTMRIPTLDDDDYVLTKTSIVGKWTSKTPDVSLVFKENKRGYASSSKGEKGDSFDWTGETMGVLTFDNGRATYQYKYRVMGCYMISYKESIDEEGAVILVREF